MSFTNITHLNITQNTGQFWSLPKLPLQSEQPTIPLPARWSEHINRLVPSCGTLKVTFLLLKDPWSSWQAEVKYLGPNQSKEEMDKIRLVIKIITVRSKRLKWIKEILRIIIEMEEEEWVFANQKILEWPSLNLRLEGLFA